MQSLSLRLSAIADIVKPCGMAADIGTDHAYIPIYLCKNNIAEKCIAGDVSRGSAQKAEENVALNGLRERISVRCGNGLQTVTPKDKAECIIIAGMGGMLMLDILKAGDLKNVKQLILQPQKDVPAVRRALHKMEWTIEEEKTVLEDGKFYNIISAVRGKEPEYTETEYETGKLLLEKKDALLKQQLLSEKKRLEALLPKVNDARKKEILKTLEIYGEALRCL